MLLEMLLLVLALVTEHHHKHCQYTVFVDQIFTKSIVIHKILCPVKNYGYTVQCRKVFVVTGVCHYRYVRAEIVAGFVNSLFLLFIAFFILAEAIEVYCVLLVVL